MSMIQITCPNCGGTAQIEAGRDAMCPYCACMLSVPQKSDKAFAQDVQFAADVQFAPPPAQQVQPVQQVQPQQDPAAAYMYPPFSEPKPVRQYPPEQLAEASKKRGFWYAMNIGMLLVQTLILTFGIGLADYFYRERLGVLVILAWLVSVPVWAVFSALIRPDEAYLNSGPILNSKKAQAVMHALLSLPATAVLSGVLYAFLAFLRFLF